MKIRKKLCNEVFYDLEWLDDFIDYLNGLKKKYNDLGWSNLKIENEGGHDGSNYVLYGTRRETEEEKLKRLERENKKKLVQEEKDRKEFEKISKRYNELKDKYWWT